MKDTFTPLPLADCHLQSNRIDIWQYPLHTEFLGANALLHPDELARAIRYHFPKHQRRFTIARAMLRIILSRYIKCQPDRLSFTYNRYGKPELMNTHSLQFNLSHSDDLALLAVGYGHPLGIDLEFFSARPYEGIAKDLFSSLEIKALHEATPRMKPFLFFHIWSQKEAFIKACGLGLSYPTQEFDVPILPGESRQILDKQQNKMWQMISFLPQIACHAALCYSSAIDEIRYLKLHHPSDMQDLLHETI
jgi:4'-phosphopantetheinyl transferase